MYGTRLDSASMLVMIADVMANIYFNNFDLAFSNSSDDARKFCGHTGNNRSGPGDR